MRKKTDTIQERKKKKQIVIKNQIKKRKDNKILSKKTKNG
jgi:hypothetical protein